MLNSILVCVSFAARSATASASLPVRSIHDRGLSEESSAASLTKLLLVANHYTVVPHLKSRWCQSAYPPPVCYRLGLLPPHTRMCASEKSTLPPLKAAVIIPGFLNDQKDFEPLARLLSSRGLPTAVVPMPIWHWIPQLGGRSVRPILERIDYAVRHVAASCDVEDGSGMAMEVPAIGYTALDFLRDFMSNPGGIAKVGGSDKPDDYSPDVKPYGTFPLSGPPQGRIALIAHSASGWISRVYLSERAYGGKAYAGAALVHSLLTLGSPHLTGKGVPFSTVEWANRESLPSSVRCLVAGARGTPSSLAIQGAYEFCKPADADSDGFVDGDGVTAIESAIGLPGAEQLILENVTHYPWTSAPLADLIAPQPTKMYRDGIMPWYGSDSIVDKWLPWLLEGITKT